MVGARENVGPEEPARKKTLMERNLCFVDLETSGLDPSRHEILELALIVTDPTAQTEIQRFEAKVLPLCAVPAEAAAINGYKAEVWADEAWHLCDALLKFLELSKDCIFVAHNASFDWGFIERALARLGLTWVGDYHKLDTAVLAYPLVRAAPVLPDGNTLSGLGLAKLAVFFGIETPRAHRAMGDVETMLEVFRRLVYGYGKLLA